MVLGLVAKVGFPLVASLAGLVLLRAGYAERKRAKAIAGADSLDAGDVSREDDYTVVEGEVREIDGDPVAAELLGEDAALVHTTVGTQSRKISEDRIVTSKRHESLDAAPFVLEDDTGAVYVDLPEGADPDLEFEVTEDVPHDSLMVHSGEMSDEVPEGVRKYVRTHDTAPTAWRRYRQGAVREGESVRVAGEVSEGPTGFDLPDVTVGPGDPDLAAATNTGELDDQSTWMVPTMIGLALLVTGVGFGLAAATGAAG